MNSEQINLLFHALANAGKAITDYRNRNPKHYYLPAVRIEILMRLANLKQYFNSK